jgi:hypothetical protein
VLRKSRTGAAVPFATRSRGGIHRLTPAHQWHRRRSELGEGDERRRHATMLVSNGTAFSERSYVACGELPDENVHTLNVCCHVCHFGVLAFRFD